MLMAVWQKGLDRELRGDIQLLHNKNEMKKQSIHPSSNNLSIQSNLFCIVFSGPPAVYKGYRENNQAQFTVSGGVIMPDSGLPVGLPPSPGQTRRALGFLGAVPTNIFYH